MCCVIQAYFGYFGNINDLISPTFYEQLFGQFPFANQIQKETVSTEKGLKALLYEKAARKMLTPGNFAIAFLACEGLKVTLQFVLSSF